MRKRKHKQIDDLSARVALRLPESRFVIMFDPKKGEWDFSGGKQEPHESDYRATAVREVLEEVGVRVRYDQIELLEKMVRRGRKSKNHYRLYFCQAFVTDEQVNRGFPVSKEHELVKVVTQAELASMENFSASSRRLAEKHGLLKT